MMAGHLGKNINAVTPTASDNETKQAMQTHFQMLGHRHLGITELRIFTPRPMVAYADNDYDFTRLCLEMDGKIPGVFVGVQPRPPHLFEKAPNRWVLARGGPDRNCACDDDIEYITTLFFDIDVVSPERQNGHPASEIELQRTLKTAKELACQGTLSQSSTVLCSGNGHYVLAAVQAIPVDGSEVARQFRAFCHSLAARLEVNSANFRIDPVYNPSRVMRVTGTINLKGEPSPERPHRRAHFVTEPVFAGSEGLFRMILNTEVEPRGLPEDDRFSANTIKCNLDRIETCCFIHYCRQHPQKLTEPQWFGLITNLAHLEGGQSLIHEISRLDPQRYEYGKTQRVIKRVISSGYQPMSCQTLVNNTGHCHSREAFSCPRIGKCPSRAPMYMTSLEIVGNH